jgi:hypothetical protein
MKPTKTLALMEISAFFDKVAVGVSLRAAVGGTLIA